MNPVVLVGRRAGDPHRDQLWSYASARWREQLGWPVAEGHHGGLRSPLAHWEPRLAEGGPFCLSAAFNRAAVNAGVNAPDWDVAVLVGADWIADTTQQVVEAAECALECGQLVFAHDRTLVLHEAATEAMLAHPVTARLPDRPPPGFALPYDSPSVGVWHPNTFSGVVAVPRTLWDQVGGFDERFAGWGFEDLAFVDACSALAGTSRVAGSIAHLWHPTDRAEREESPTHGLNQVLWERYRAARGSAEAMAALLAEPGGPRAPKGQQ